MAFSLLQPAYTGLAFCVCVQTHILAAPPFGGSGEAIEQVRFG